MIFQYSLIENIPTRNKTQTRRPVKPGESLVLAIDHNRDTLGLAQAVLTAKANTKWQVGRDYAVVPKRGKPGLWWNPETKDIGFQRLKSYGYVPLRIRITNIRREDCRNISEQDAKAEGFESPNAFLFLWVTLYDPRMVNSRMKERATEWRKELNGRPSNLYDVWALTFEVVR